MFNSTQLRWELLQSQEAWSATSIVYSTSREDHCITLSLESIQWAMYALQNREDSVELQSVWQEAGSHRQSKDRLSFEAPI